ncbi:MAG: tRNA pseudouridine(38-40) synthase TruA [Thermoguttaceae bacterium]|nr:tRNA pseudouridine(38-40) synthase TruA [Thermoguttaceae bacterium]MBQ4202663.1 tRNA pseudouridine(38-40) synthase TruA [Thermoguttaceae bacterium]MBQ5367311.1 tRNA pseudouridine(38-40) synthase TruA [Thermoguttaceae bacterium]
MRRVKLELCYDGSNYSGWQIQPKQPKVKTIQGELEKAVERVVCEHVEVLGSGRTDAGVHALCQVASFVTESQLPVDAMTRAINAFLPHDIRIWRVLDVPLDFHPIRDVVRKRYRYLASDSRPAYPFFRRYAWNLLQRVDLAQMRNAAALLLGTHDFSAFQTVGSPRKSTVRTIFDIRVERLPLDAAFRFPKLSPPCSEIKGSSDDSIRRENAGFPDLETPGLISFEVEADGFLYNMVRAIVGTLYLFGQRHKGFENPAFMDEIIKKADRRLAGPTAPPHGLYMINVVYPDDAYTS